MKTITLILATLFASNINAQSAEQYIAALNAATVGQTAEPVESWPGGFDLPMTPAELDASMLTAPMSGDWQRLDLRLKAEIAAHLKRLADATEKQADAIAAQTVVLEAIRDKPAPTVTIDTTDLLTKLDALAAKMQEFRDFAASLFGQPTPTE